MPKFPFVRITFALVVAASSFSSVSHAAQPPGPITVRQVLDLFDTIETDPEAGKLLFAYLSGVGETAGVLISEARKTGAYDACSGSLSLDGTTVEAALRQSGGESAERPATPVIIADMLKRASCQ